MKKRVLIVDDDRSVRESLRKVLADAGYSVAVAADSQEAWKRFQRDCADLLLLDIGLPVKSGWDAFERITSQKPTLPIIVITGKTDQYNTALAAGVGALMQKPLDVAHLLRTMDELLAEPDTARLRRLCGYNRDVRYVPCDSELLSQKLERQQKVPLGGLHWFTPEDS